MTKRKLTPAQERALELVRHGRVTARSSRFDFSRCTTWHVDGKWQSESRRPYEHLHDAGLIHEGGLIEGPTLASYEEWKVIADD